MHFFKHIAPFAVATIFLYSGVISQPTVEASSFSEENVLLENETMMSPRMTLWGVKTTSGFTNSIQAWFTPSAKTTVTDWGLTTGKNVKQAYVRLIEGDYDSGRKYSSAASSTSDSATYYTPKVSKTNNIIQTAKSSWNWIYFK